MRVASISAYRDCRGIVIRHREIGARITTTSVSRFSLLGRDIEKREREGEERNCLITSR